MLEDRRDEFAVWAICPLLRHDAHAYCRGAMTMSFMARAATQLAGFSVGDRVRFTFTVTDDGRRLLDAVERVR